MFTRLNSEMLVVFGHMGRDLAAFAYPADAYAFAETRPGCHFRRPDGQTRTHVASADALDAWAVAWNGREG